MSLAFVPTAGRKLRASELAEMVAQINSLTAPGWTSYTPTWSSTGTQPVLNNGTLTGRYRRAATSDLIIAQVRLLFGSTTTLGTGAYFFSAPVNASATGLLTATGAMYVLDSGTLDKAGVWRFEDATKFKGVTLTGGVITNTSPQTWAVNDILSGQIAYEPV